MSFRCYGRVYLIPRLTLDSGKAVRSKLDCMHEPPVQSDCCAFSGNYQLESNPERHDKAPLAAATGKQDVREMYREFGNDSNLLIVFYVQIMPDDFVMQLHRF